MSETTERPKFKVIPLDDLLRNYIEMELGHNPHKSDILAVQNNGEQRIYWVFLNYGGQKVTANAVADNELKGSRLAYRAGFKMLEERGIYRENGSYIGA